jgi:transposase-like protein
MAKTKVKLEIKRHRIFSEEFKKRKVKELEQKRTTILELSREYAVSRVAIYKWLYKYSVHYHQSTKLVVQMDSEQEKTNHFRQRNAELERIVGQKQLEIDFLLKMIELASSELGFDIKKNFNTKQSNGIDTINPNTDIK